MQSLGEYVVLLDPSVEVVGDILGPISQWLQADGIGMVGPWGLRSQDLSQESGKSREKVQPLKGGTIRLTQPLREIGSNKYRTFSLNYQHSY